LSFQEKPPLSKGGYEKGRGIDKKEKADGGGGRRSEKGRSSGSYLFGEIL